MTPLTGRASRGRAPRSRSAPTVLAPQSHLETVRRVVASTFVLGGVTGLVSLLTAPMERADAIGQAALSVLLLASGVVVWAIRPASRRVLEACAPWSILLISALVVISEPLRMMTIYYLWPVVLIAYFGSFRVLVGTYTWMVVALVCAVHLNATADLHPDDAIATLVTAGLMAAVVAAMNRSQGRLRADLATAAETDPLTGLLNRRAFHPRLDVLVAEAEAQGSPLSVVMFDLDHFKKINDEHGHLGGDRALQSVAAVLMAHTRDGDLVSRFGGEEFAVALPGAPIGNAVRYAERVAAALDAPFDGASVPLTTSAGVAELRHGVDAETLLLHADTALYAAKEAGRCRAGLFTNGVTVGPTFAACRTPRRIGGPAE